MSGRGEVDGRRKIKLELKHKPILERPRVTVSSGTNTRRSVPQSSNAAAKPRSSGGESSSSIPASAVAPGSSGPLGFKLPTDIYPTLASAVVVPQNIPPRNDSKLAAAVAAAAEIVRRKRRSNRNAGTEPTLSRFSEAGIKPSLRNEEEDESSRHLVPTVSSTVTVVPKPELTQITQVITNDSATVEASTKPSASSASSVDKPPPKGDSSEKPLPRSSSTEGEASVVSKRNNGSAEHQEVLPELPKPKEKEERARKRSVSIERSPAEKKQKQEKPSEPVKTSGSKSSTMRRDDSPERKSGEGTGAKKKSSNASLPSARTAARSTARRDDPSPRHGVRTKPRPGGGRRSRSRSRSRSRGNDKRKASSSTSSSESSSSSSSSSSRSSSSGSSSSSSSEEEGSSKRRFSASSASPAKKRAPSKNMPSKAKRLPSGPSGARRSSGPGSRNVKTSPGERKRMGGKGNDSRSGPPRTPPGKTAGFGGNKIDKDDFRPKSFVGRAEARKRPRSRSASYSPAGKYASDDDDDDDKERTQDKSESRRRPLDSKSVGRTSKPDRSKSSPDRPAQARREGRGSHTPPPSIASSASVVALSATKRRSVSKESSRSPSSVRGRRGRSGSARKRSSRSPLPPSSSNLKSVVGAVDPKKKKVDPKRTTSDKKGVDRKPSTGNANVGRIRDRDKDKVVSRTSLGGKRSAVLEMDRERRNSRPKITRTSGGNRRRRSRSSSRDSSRSRGRVDRSGGIGVGSGVRRRRKDDEDTLGGSKVGLNSRGAKKRTGRRRQGISIAVRSPPPLPPMSHMDYHRTRPDVDDFLRPLINPWDADERGGRWPVHPLPFADFQPYPDEALHRRNRRSESDAGTGSFASLRMRGDHRLVGLPPPPPPHHVHPLSNRGHMSSWPDASTAWDRDGRGGRRERDRERLLRRRPTKHVGDWRDDGKGQRFGGRPRSPGSPLLPPQDDGSPARLHSRGVRYPDGPYGSDLPGEEGRLGDVEGETGLRHAGKRGSGRRLSVDNEEVADGDQSGRHRLRRDGASREKDAAGRSEEGREARGGSSQPDAGDAAKDADASAARPSTPDEGGDEERASGGEGSDNEGGGGMGLGEEEEEWETIDFEEISDEELTANEDEQEDAAEKTKPSIADILDVDWSELLAETSKRPEGAAKKEIDSGAGDSAKLRLAPGRLFAEIGVSSKFAGPATVDEIKAVCREAMPEIGVVKEEGGVKKEELENGDVKLEKNDFEFLSPIASFHMIRLRMKRKRKSVFSDLSAICRGFSARKDLQVRNFLKRFAESNNNKLPAEQEDDMVDLEGCNLDSFDEAVQMYRLRNT